MEEDKGNTKGALRSLCRDNGWSYGVLWRFDPRNSMLLTREDALYEEHHIGQVIGSMLRQVHVLGEGAVGRAALTGKHQWMFADPQESQEADPEVLHQFSAGVETLVMIPLKYHGVVQFGAMKKIVEKDDFVDETKKLFLEMVDVNGIFQAGNVPPSSHSETHDMDSLFASLLSHGNSCNGNFKAINSGVGLEELVGNNLSSSNKVQSMAFGYEEDLSYLLTSIPSDGPCISSWSSEGSVLTSHEPPLPSSILTHDSSNAYFTKLNMGAGNYGIRHCQSIGQTGVELPKVSSGLKRSFEEFDSANPTADVSSSCLIDDLSQLLAGSPEHSIVEAAGCFDYSIKQSILENSGNCNPSNVLSTEKDLFDSFGVDLGCILDGNCWDSLSNSIPTTDNAVLGYPFMSAPRKGLFSELGIEELLDGTGSTITKSSFKDPLSTSKRKGAQGYLSNGTITKSSFKDPLSTSKRKGAQGYLSNGTDSYSQKELLHRSQAGLWDAVAASVCPPKRAEEPAKPIRKRAIPGESTRPRPKDRQQIQDRLKELRGIIPNGAKCSIDMLLDRTIKHMLFLQNVMKYADKLKQNDKPKLAAHENVVFLKDECRRGAKGDTGGGTMLAIEVGSQSMVCPVIVEDLSSPGQMQIEMLCEERGLFLEIANIIHGFGLNILKGVMEVRHSKIWSHFIVEATRHVTRIDVFWSLVQLLQQTVPGGPDFPNCSNHLTDGAILPCKTNTQSVLSLPIS